MNYRVGKKCNINLIYKGGLRIRESHPALSSRLLIVRPVKRPLIGARATERGVVTTCSYEARKFGVRSGMNIKDAYRLCPNSVYMRPNFDKYRAVSEQLHGIWNAYAAASEYVALDETYLDVTERAGTWEGAREAARDFVALIHGRDVKALNSVGPKTAQKLNAAGIYTVDDVRQRREEVVRLLGKRSRWITQLAFGVDDRKAIPYRPEDAKSVSKEYPQLSCYGEEIRRDGF